MRDLFASKLNGHAYLPPIEDPFRWVVAVFSTDGAVQVIRRVNASERPLKMYYPIRLKHNGRYVALWANYLFIEFIEGVTIELCRTTTKFIRVISARNNDGIVRPVMVRKNAIAESLRLMTQGKFNYKVPLRKSYGRGSIVAILDGVMANRKVRLDEDVLPNMSGSRRVKVDIDGIKGVIPALSGQRRKVRRREPCFLRSASASKWPARLHRRSRSEPSQDGYIGS